MNNPREESLSHFEMGRQWAKSMSNSMSQPQQYQPQPYQPQGYAQGTDSVPAVIAGGGRAMLTPGEAILTRNAAMLMGRDRIAQLNAQGNRLAEQGIDLAGRSAPRHYEKGEEEVKGANQLPEEYKTKGFWEAVRHALFADTEGDIEARGRNSNLMTYGPRYAPPVTEEIPGYARKRLTEEHGLQYFPVRPYYEPPGVGVAPSMVAPASGWNYPGHPAVYGDPGNYVPPQQAEYYRNNVQPGYYQGGTSNIRNPRHYQTGTDYVTDSNPFAFRAQYKKELEDPTIRQRLYSLTHREVGGQSPAAQQAFLETVFNRAHARGKTLAETIGDSSYYPSKSLKPAQLYPDQASHYEVLTSKVLQGSNTSNYATGNASGSVGFAGGPRTASYSGENFGLEGSDIPFFQRLTGLKAPPAAINVSATPPEAGGTSPTYNSGRMAYEASQAEQASAEAETEKTNPWATAAAKFGESVQKQAAAGEEAAQAQMKTAISNVPTSNPLLASLAGDPTSPYRNALAMSQYPTNEFQPMFGMGG